CRHGACIDPALKRVPGRPITQVRHRHPHGATMASISTGGSGLDIASLVSQLVTATRLPTEKRITAASTTASAKLSAVGQVKSALTSLQSALQEVVGSAGTAAFKTAVPTDAGFTATASDKAVPGSYSVEVV